MEKKMKKLNYMDNNTLEYVSLEATLRKNIKEQELNSFYHSIQDKNLSKIFHKMMDQEVLNTKELVDYISNGENTLQVQIYTKNYFNLFEYQNETRMTSEEYTLYMDLCVNQHIFGSTAAHEAIEKSQAFNNNTVLLNYIGYTPKVRTEKIIPFMPKKVKSGTQQA